MTIGIRSHCHFYGKNAVIPRVSGRAFITGRLNRHVARTFMCAQRPAWINPRLRGDRLNQHGDRSHIYVK